MTASALAKLYLATVATFLLADLVWIGLVASRFYRSGWRSSSPPR